MLGHAPWIFFFSFIKSQSKIRVQLYAISPALRTFAPLVEASPMGSASQMQVWSGLRGCLKAKGNLRKAILPLQPRETLVVQEIKMEPCSHAFDLDRYETRPAFPFAVGRHAHNTVLIVSPPG